MTENTAATPAPEPLGSLMSGAWRFLRERAALVLAVWAPTGLLGAALVELSRRSTGLVDGPAVNAAFEEHRYGALAAFTGVALVAGLLRSVNFLAITLAAARHKGGAAATAREALEGALERLPAVLWTGFCVLVRVGAVLLVLPLLAFVGAYSGLMWLVILSYFALIPALILALRYGMAHFVPLLGGPSGSAALARSSELYRAHAGKVAGNLFAFVAVGALAVIPAAIVQVLVSAVLGGAAGAVLGGALVSLIGAWVSAASVGLYLALQSR